MIIETKNLTKKYKSKAAVNNLNLSIKEGELFSLLGVNGAGKTTTIKMITSLIKPTEGEIFINGKLLELSIIESKKLINLSPQETAIAPNLTVLENLEFMAGVYSIKNTKEKINELLKMFKLEEMKKQKASTLSGGWQRRLSIALALINNPKILFLDEPTLGLDVLARKELWDIINDLKKSSTIILTTHYMEEAEALSDRVGIMSNGNLLFVGSINEVLKKTEEKTLEKAFIKIVTGGETK